MAPKNEPSSLYRLSLSAVSLAVDSACTNIFLEHGCYGNEECMTEIERMQERLFTDLPLTVFEHLVDDRNSQTRGNQLLWSKDPRIKLGVFLHPSISRFNVDAKGNELFQPQQHHDHDGGLDEFFWCAQIRRLANLVVINLNLITTDSILAVVGDSCPNLEQVNVVSRIKQDTASLVDIHHSQQYFPSPGITLKFCVSDVGLRCLLKCQKLKRITMNKNINHNLANRGISLAGVRALVDGLPHLEYINFGSIGKVLDSGKIAAAPLKLNYFSELDPAHVNVSQLSLLCPNIQHISLSVPININAAGEINTNVGPCNSILDALATSDLVLRIVELQHFPYGESFKTLLRNKGARMEELLFRANGPLNSTHMAFIGETCPNMQRLHLKEVGAEEERSYGISDHVKKRLFQKLLYVHISGRLWSPGVILPLLLSAAADVRQISLLNMSHRSPMDSAVLRLLQYNKLQHVSSVNLYSGCFLSLPIIRQLTYGCPRLRGFSFLQFESIDLADVDELRAEVTAKNLDIKLCCLELFDL
jgi:hypothetical protein